MFDNTDNSIKEEDVINTFKNVSGKIKGFAVAILWIGIILSIVFGIKYIVDCDHYYVDGSDFFLAFLIAVGGGLASRFCSLMVHGFGEMMEGIADIRMKLMVEKPAEKKE